MDWEEAVDFAEPGNMDDDDLVEMVARRLDIFWGLRPHDDVQLKRDLHFIYLVLFRLLTNKDYNPESRPLAGGRRIAGVGGDGRVVFLDEDDKEESTS
jgi:hypothetical protein